MISDVKDCIKFEKRGGNDNDKPKMLFTKLY